MCGTVYQTALIPYPASPGPLSSELELQAIPGAHALSRHIGWPLSERARHPREERKAAGWGFVPAVRVEGVGEEAGHVAAQERQWDGWMQGMQRGGWEAGWSGSRGVTFLLHPCQACGAEMNVRGLLMRPRGVKHSLLLRAE